MNSQKRKCFSIEEKAVIIQRLEIGESNAKLAREYGVSHSTISTILKNKHKIEPLFNANVLKPKRVRTATQEEVETALLKWFKVQRDRGIPIHGPILQEKANSFAQQLNLANFHCSASWINRFKARHNIVYGKIAGEALSVQHTDVNNWLSKVWPHLRSKFTNDDIFNADEAGLFFKLTPNHTSKFKGEKCIGGKLSKDRLTILLAANMSGTIKKKMLVIGKSKNPRCFKNIKSLPVDYVSNRKAWMSSDIFTKWLCDWDRELTKNKKKILLLIDNSPAHPIIDYLKNITIVFLPPNTTSVLQPLDQGIIRTFKSYFKKNLVLKIIEHLDKNKIDNAEQPQITILDAIIMMYDSWNKVSQSTIFNCFKHAGFVKDNLNECTTSILSNVDYEDDVPLSVWVRSLEKNLPIANEELEEFATVDDDLVTCEDVTNENILQNTISSNENSGDSTDEDDQISTPSVSDALKSADTLNIFIHANFDDENIKSMMSRIHNEIRTNYYYKHKQKQTKITDFINNL